MNNFRRLSRRAGSILKHMRTAKEKVTTAQEYETFHEPTVRTQLESSLSMLVQSKNDARARLEVFRLLPISTLYCLITPLGPYDPLNVIPQLFSFERLNTPEGQREDKVIAVPVFTSLHCVETFGRRFDIPVKGPDGDLWVDGTQDRDLLPRRKVDVDDSNNEDAQVLSRIAKPIFLFGAPTLPHLVGTFGDFANVMQFVDIYPSSVDIILNAGTPLHWHMARDLVRTMQTGTLVAAPIYHDIASEICRELSRYFRHECDEVVMASFVVMPLDVVNDQSQRHPFCIAFMVISDCWAITTAKIEQGYASCAILGHPAATIVDQSKAPPHYVELGSIFYERAPGEGKSVEGSFLVHPLSVKGLSLHEKD